MNEDLNSEQWINSVFLTVVRNTLFIRTTVRMWQEGANLDGLVSHVTAANKPLVLQQIFYDVPRSAETNITQWELSEWPETSVDKNRIKTQWKLYISP